MATQPVKGELIAVPTPTPASALDAGSPVHKLVSLFLAGRSQQTLRAYARDLEDFAAFTGDVAPDQAAGRLLARGHGPANALALEYRNHLLGRGLAPATVNRRLAALRSLIKLGRILGMVTWQLEVEGVRAEAYRDTRGPGREGFRQLLDKARVRTDANGLRDVAIIRLLYDVALRRAEVCRLDLVDVDLQASKVSVLGKGRSQKELLTLPTPTAAALAAWIGVRGPAPGPLFTSLDRAGKGDGRLTGAAVYQLVRQLGAAVGVKTRPHGLRHAAISRVLDLTNGNIRETQKFSRHKAVQTILKYDDARTDAAGQLAGKLAEDAAA